MATWIVATDPATVGPLATDAGEDLAVIVALGDRTSAVAAAQGPFLVMEVEADPVPEALAPAVARAVAAASPTLVLVENTPAGRVFAGAIVAATGAAAIAQATRWQVQEGGVSLTITRHGGIVEEEVECDGPAVILRDPISEPKPPAATTAPVERIEAVRHDMSLLSQDVAVVEAVDLGAASVVIGVGRGLKTEADLAAVEALASALGAEIGCTRPLAEGVTWLPKSRYIGVSGLTIAPDLYVALGISGQLQHMAGVRGAGRIVAVNTDPEAPIHAEADYTIIADLYAILPALTEAARV
jgi:electron transfer flavoprotein alpha subunit